MNPDQKGNLDKLIAGNPQYSVQCPAVAQIVRQPTPRALVHGVLLCWGQMLRLVDVGSS